MTIPSPFSPSPLVGRGRELGVLRDHLTAALAGHGSLVLIGGEAGIGKTALAEVICREATEQDALVLVGRCFDLADTPAYGPWLYLFERYHPTDALPARPAAFAEAGRMGAVASQAALFRQVLDFMGTLAAQRPVVLFLDDLHWADPASLDLLRSLGQSVGIMPLSIVATYRSDELTRHTPLNTLLPALVREANAGRMTLRPLDTAAVHTLVADRYQLSDESSLRLAAHLHARSEGNPFFLGELLRTLQESTVLAQTPHGWVLSDLVPVPVPTLLRQVIDGRVDRTGTDARHLLVIASVIGQDLSLVHWRAIAAVDEAALLECIERAVGARLLDSSPTGTRVHFVHALIRQTLYEGIVPARRRILHRQIGDAMAMEPSADPDAVAYHLQQAGDARAIPWLIQAGERAERAYAWLTAADRFEAAVTLMDTDGADAGARGWLLVRVARLRRYTNPRQGIARLDIAAQLATEANDDLLGALTLFHRGLLLCFVSEINRGLAEMRAGVMARKKLSVADRARAAGMPSVFALHDACEDNGEEALVHWLAGAGRFAEARALVFTQMRWSSMWYPVSHASTPFRPSFDEH